MVVEQRNSLNTILRFTILHYFPPLLQTNKNESLFYTDGGRSWPALCSLSAPQPNPSWAFCSESLVIMFGHLLVYAPQCGMIPLFVCLFVSRSSLRTPWPTAPSCSYLVVKTRIAPDLLADQRTPMICMLLFRRITRYRINSRMNTHTRTQTHPDTQTHILKHTQTNTHRHTHTHVCSHKSTQWDCMLILQLLVVACSCMKALSQLLLWLALLTLLDWECEMCAYFSSTNTHTHISHMYPKCHW